MIFHELEAKQWLQRCYEIASQSPDPSTNVGAAIIIGNQLQESTLSCNQPTAGWTMTDEEWKDREYKLQVVEHAERAAIYAAARQGLWTDGATLVGNWAACTDCARGIVESGIKTLIRHQVAGVAATPGWERSLEIADQILIANNVTIHNVTGPILGAPKVLRGGEWYDPSTEPAETNDL